MKRQKTKEDFPDFGISIRHLGVRHSDDWGCECGWMIEKRYIFDNWKQFIVGFSTNPPETQMREDNEEIKNTVHEYIGGIVIECPQCSKRSWFHVTLGVMRKIFPE
ncbi:MAG: hypothetical protein AAB946_00085 [Patescibacteria group bacterium]